jgi:large subunit ribosomal protein L25
MKSVALAAFPRTQRRRGAVKKLRHGGRVPAVIYGRQIKPQNLELSIKDIKDLIHRSGSENILVDLAISEDSRPQRLALVQEVQHHVLSGEILHVDLHEVAENEKVTIDVPVETTGEAIGVKASGGILEHVLFKIKARALPRDLPEVLLVDVSHLEIGQAIHIGDIKAPERVELLGDKNIPVLAVAAPITEAEELAATAAAPTEVEVIKEKKEEGAAEGAAPAKGAAEKPGDKAEKAEKKPEKKK